MQRPGVDKKFVLDKMRKEFRITEFGITEFRIVVCVVVRDDCINVYKIKVSLRKFTHQLDWI